MPRRMRVRLSLLAARGGCSRSLLWSLLPVGSSADPTPGQLQKKIDRNNSLIGGHKARERVLTTDISSQTRRIDTLQSDITRLSDAPAEAADEPRRQARGARRGAAAAAPGARPADAAAGAADRRPPRARGAAGRALQGRSAGRRHRRARVRRLRGPAQPHRVHDQRLQAGREDHGHRRPTRRRTRPRPRRGSTGSRGARSGSRRRSSPSATRCRRCASGSSTAATGSRARARPSSRCCGSSRDRRHELQDDVEELRDAQARIQARLAGFSGPVSAGPVKPGSGGLIWPVNGPITSPFCEARSWESCHPGIDIGVPAGTPIRAAAAGKVVLMQSAGVVRRLRELHLRPARRRAVDVLRAPVALRHVVRRGRVARGR